MRVLHLLAGTGWGGAERTGCLLHQLAQQHGHESRIDGRGLPEMIEGARAACGVELQRAEADTWRWALGARARRRAYEPDLVHAHLATPGLAGAVGLIAGRRPLALTFHLLPAAARWPNDYLLRLPSELVLEGVRRTRRRCTFVSVSDHDRERLQQRFQAADVAVTHNIAAAAPASEPAPSLPYPAGVVRLLSVGRLVEQKGFDRMLAVLSQPELRALPWHWLIVGEGAARGSLQSDIVARDLTQRVKVLGALPATGLYPQADLVLCPSRNEGAPLVPLESRRAGVPALLSEIPAHRELTSAGILPEQESAWAAALLPLLQSEDARAALRAAQAPKDLRDPSERLWDECLTIYRRLLGERRETNSARDG